MHDVDALTGVGEEQRLVLLVPAHPVVLVLGTPEDLDDRAVPRTRSLAPVDADQVPDLPTNGLVFAHAVVLLLGADRDSELLPSTFGERDPAVWTT
jgi:hypothetical protein